MGSQQMSKLQFLHVKTCRQNKNSRRWTALPVQSARLAVQGGRAFQQINDVVLLVRGPPGSFDDDNAQIYREVAGRLCPVVQGSECGP